MNHETITVYVAEIHWQDDPPGYSRFAAVALSLDAMVSELAERQNVHLRKQTLEPGFYLALGCSVHIRAFELTSELDKGQ